MIPAGILLFAFEAARLGFLALREMERQTPQGAKVFRRVVHTGPALVLAQVHIPHPVALVLHAPVSAHGAREAGRVQSDLSFGLWIFQVA